MSTTPGVTYKEISTIAPSVAEVATAIPAFVGYAKVAPEPNRPIRIRSMREFETWFGGCVKTELPTPPESPTNELTFLQPTWLLWHSMQLYFMNGGGPCWVHAKQVTESQQHATLKDLGDLLDVFKKISEPTLLVCPDALKLIDSDRRSLYERMVNQCKELSDRFCILDAIPADLDANPFGAVDSRGLLPPSSSYAAAYYPWLRCNMPFYGDASENTHVLQPNQTQGQVSSPSLYDWQQAAKAYLELARGVDYRKFFDGHPADNVAEIALSPDFKVTKDLATLLLTTAAGKEKVHALFSAADSLVESISVHQRKKLGELLGAMLTEDTDYDTADSNDQIAKNSAKSKKDAACDAYIDANREANKLDKLKVALSGAQQTVKDSINSFVPNGYSIIDTRLPGKEEEKDTCHAKDRSKLWQTIRNTRTLLPPSAAIAGIYASVDRTRGVWKAPANVALSGVIGPSVELSAVEHGEFNVDAVNGRSINVIKSNSAGDVLVMGARTMDGNSNEWRFVSTRRFFIMVEESIANSVQWAVFEPNDANTWARVQSSVEKFLTQKWREGALFGGSPAEAFSVSVGLGRTMTADDILKGFMKVNIAMRVVTPAEVVELRFSHKIIK
jgi:phage tail sheath protein FI